MTPEEIVDRQLLAYNARDAEAFAACYAEDVTLYNGPGEIMLSGRERLRAHYADYFARYPAVRAEVVSRQVLEPYIADREHMVRDTETDFEALVLYCVENGAIAYAHFYRN